MAIAEYGIRENLAKYYDEKSAPTRLEGVGGEAGQTPILLTKSRRGWLRWTAPVTYEVRLRNRQDCCVETSVPMPVSPALPGLWVVEAPGWRESTGGPR